MTSLARAAFLIGWLVVAVQASISTEARSDERSYEKATGEFAGEVVNLRWKKVRRTSYQPDVVFLLENSSANPVSVVFNWNGPVCSGTTYSLSKDALRLLGWLYPQFGPSSTLKPNEWDAFVFPLALPTATERPTEGDACVHELEIRAISDGVRDRVRIVLPAPAP